MNLSESLIFTLLNSDNEFPVDFDDAWQWVGYTRKENALNKLSNNFDIDLDYIKDKNIFSPFGEKMEKGRQPDRYYMTIDCFKSFCMMAGTSKGKDVRRYFLDCERRLKILITEAQSQSVKTLLISAIVSKDIVSTESKFKDWFYEMLYRKRGGEWAKRSTKKRPSCVAKWTNKVVYDKMIGGTSEESVKASLNTVNPKIDGVRKHPLHNYFSEFGINYLQDHFKSLQLIDRITPDGDWDRFIYTIEKAFPVEGENLQLNLFYELEKFLKSG